MLFRPLREGPRRQRQFRRCEPRLVALRVSRRTALETSTSQADTVWFKLDCSGVLSRVAGNSRVGYSGDGGPAIQAQLPN